MSNCANYTGKAHPNGDIAKGRIKIHRGKAMICKFGSPN